MCIRDRDAVDRKKYEVLKIGITRDGTWLEYEGGTDEIRDDGWASHPSCTPAKMCIRDSIMSAQIRSPGRGTSFFSITSDSGMQPAACKPCSMKAVHSRSVLQEERNSL